MQTAKPGTVKRIVGREREKTPGTVVKIVSMPIDTTGKESQAMQATKAKFEVGQQLWFVSNEHPRRAPAWVVIAKVGRKWLELEGGSASDYRADIETMLVSAGRYSCGRCYLSREEWELVYLAEEAWKKFRSEMNSRTPIGISAAEIELVRRLFKQPDEGERLKEMKNFVEVWELATLQAISNLAAVNNGS